MREDFSEDRVERIRKGQPGADILHKVMHKGQGCGSIIYDSKKRQAWQNGFVAKLRQDQVEAGAEHAIIATTVFPSGKKELTIESDVIVVNPARVVYIVRMLRQAMITMHIRGLSLKERNGKMGRLYSLITSEAFTQQLNEAINLTKDILELDVHEKRTHDNVWKKRGALAIRMNNVLRDIDTNIAAIIEGAEPNESARFRPPAEPGTMIQKRVRQRQRAREETCRNKRPQSTGVTAD